jgi:heptaprenyl diphosphate synthase
VIGGVLVIVEGYPELRRELRVVEAKIRECLESRVSIIREACDDLLDAGGKRVRPLLALVASSYGKDDRSLSVIRDVAAAVEIIHTATLVHDDIIDESRLRRGRETAQSRWGKDIAVFLGDYLFTQALLLLGSATASHSGLVPAVARGLRYICEGEVRQFADRYRLDLGVSSYLHKIRGKTAMLFALSCGLGAGCSGCSRRVTTALIRYGMNLGMAFQINDDIMDFACGEERMGKPRTNDIRTGVYTLPVILGSQDSRFGKRITHLAQNPEGTDEWTQRLADAVRKSGALEACSQLLQRYIDKARHHMEKLPRGRYSPLLASLPEAICLAAAPAQVMARASGATAGIR